MDASRFEHTHKLSQEQYVALFGLLTSDKRPWWARRIGLATVGIAYFFSWYTFLLGVAILALAYVAVFAPRFLPGTAAKWYGVDHERLWLRAQGLSPGVAWRHVSVWDERGGWLIVPGRGLPALHPRYRRESTRREALQRRHSPPEVNTSSRVWKRTYEAQY